MPNTNYLLSLNQEMWEEAALRCETAADSHDDYIRSFFRFPTDLLTVVTRSLNLATALDASYYGLDTLAWEN